MGYVNASDLSESIDGCASCGPSCGCKPCQEKYHGFGERYIKDEDDDRDDDGSNGRSAGVSGFGAAIAIPAITVGVVLEALAVAAALIAAALLLLAAYEAAKERGIGVTWAMSKAVEGVNKVMAGVRKALELLREALRRARNMRDRGPRCDEAMRELEDAVTALAMHFGILSRPQPVGPNFNPQQVRATIRSMLEILDRARAAFTKLFRECPGLFM